MGNVPSYIWIATVLYWILFFLPTYLCLKATKSGRRIGQYRTWITINIALVLGYFFLPLLGAPRSLVDSGSQVGWFILIIYIMVKRYELNSATEEAKK